MSEIIYIPDYADQAVSLLPSQYRRAARLRALLRSLGSAAQIIEDAAFDTLVGDNPTDATGATLERWGRIVGQPQGGLTAEEYRRFIEARISANITGSSMEELLELWTTITAPAEVRHFQTSPAGYALVTWREMPMRSALRVRVRELMQSVKPAAIGLTLIEAGPKIAAYRYDDGPGLDVGQFARIL